MGRRGRRILLAVEPGVLEGALAKLLSSDADDEVIQVGRRGLTAPGGRYDAAIVSDRLPDGVRAEVVITLPDARDSRATGTVRSGNALHDVGIGAAERVVEILEHYVPR
jgi:hypothetical protein